MASFVKGYSEMYPKIHVDKEQNTHSGDSMIAKVSVEWVSDMERHTHKLSELIDDTGAFITSGVANNIILNGGGSVDGNQGLSNKVDQLLSTVQTLVQENTILKEKVAVLESKVNSGSGDTPSAVDGFIVGDWDASQDGVQSFEESNTYNR